MYDHLIVGELPEYPCVVVLSRWDGQRAKVFPSKRGRQSRQAVVFEPQEIPSELTELDRIIANGTERSTFRVDFVPPDQAQAFIDALETEINNQRTVDVTPRGFSPSELEKMGLNDLPQLRL